MYRRDPPARFAAKSRGRLSGERGEASTEGAQAGVADLEAHLGNGQVTGGEQLAGLVHAKARSEILRRLAEGAREETLKMERRKASLPSGAIERHGRVVAGGEQVARAAEASEGGVVHQHGFKVQRRAERLQLRVSAQAAVRFRT
jgi:hypothetical protein